MAGGEHCRSSRARRQRAQGRRQVADRRSQVVGHTEVPRSSYGTMRYEGIQKPQGWQENRKGRAGGCMPAFPIMYVYHRRAASEGAGGGHTQGEVRFVRPGLRWRRCWHLPKLRDPGKSGKLTVVQGGTPPQTRRYAQLWPAPAARGKRTPLVICQQRNVLESQLWFGGAHWTNLHVRLF